MIHVASPLPLSAPKTEDEVIVTARDGVLRVLKFARDAKVKRVVLTSSCGAVYSIRRGNDRFTRGHPVAVVAWPTPLPPVGA